MKKISTLIAAIAISASSFAAYAPNRLTVVSNNNAPIKVTVDGNRYNQQSYDNSIVFENLEPGFHSIRVFQAVERRSFFGRRTDWNLVYSGSVQTRPLTATTVELGRYGNARIDEQPMRGAPIYRDGRDNRDRDFNRGYDRNGNNGYGYGRNISNEDFYAAQRTMQREQFDDARLLYAKKLMDDCYMSSNQVMEMARFFSMDQSRLDFAKYAYNRTSDKNNFTVVGGAFSSTNGRNQFTGFLRTCQ